MIGMMMMVVIMMIMMTKITVIALIPNTSLSLNTARFVRDYTTVPLCMLHDASDLMCKRRAPLPRTGSNFSRDTILHACIANHSHRSTHFSSSLCFEHSE